MTTCDEERLKIAELARMVGATFVDRYGNTHKFADILLPAYPSEHPRDSLQTHADAIAAGAGTSTGPITNNSSKAISEPRDSIVHQCPPRGMSMMPCCSRTPFEAPRTDRLTLNPNWVTCPGPVTERKEI